MQALKEKIERELLTGLNEVQREAVLHEEGPLLILAGAGSGKTRVITHRIAHLCRVREVSPWNIAAVTFTNKATQEMVERLAALIGPMAQSVFVKTFHSLGLHILRRHAAEAGLRSGFSIYDDSAQKSLLKTILKEKKIRPDFMSPEAAGSLINRARDSLETPEMMADSPDPYRREGAAIYREYIERLRANNAVDFGDLLFETVRLFENHPGILEGYRGLWRYFLIDEYQDTNHAQYMLGRLIAGEHRNIVVVGDDDQSIYSWRGANLSNILSFEKDYPGCRILHLEENYRSNAFILRAASSVIARNEMRRKKTLFTRKEGGEPIEYLSHDTEQDEVHAVISRIRHHHSSGMRLRDMAIFYRTNAQSRIFETALRESRIPYVLYGGFRFYDRKEIKDLVAYLAVIVNPDDSVSLERIINTPARGIGDTGLERLREISFRRGISLLDAMDLAHEIPRFRSVTQVKELRRLFTVWREAALAGESAASICQMVYEESGYRDSLRLDPSPDSASRQENVKEFIGSIQEFEEQQAALSGGETASESTGGLDAFLQNISLMTSETNPEAPSENDDAVYLMTLHNAKGLEFPVVFITGLEEGFLPHMLSLEEGNLEEERRLMYVGITRAMRHLYLSGCRFRRIFGTVQPRIPSRFLEEIDREVFRTGSSAARVPRQPPYAGGAMRNSLPSGEGQKFRKGERVEHEKYGAGMIRSVEETVAGQKLTVEFERDGSERNFLTRYAPIRKIN